MLPIGCAAAAFLATYLLYGPIAAYFARLQESLLMATIRAAETKRQETKAKRLADLEALKNITQTIDGDDKTLASDTAASAALLKKSGKPLVGPFTRPDSTAYALIADSSADGFHEADMASPDDEIADEPPANPPDTGVPA